MPYNLKPRRPKKRAPICSRCKINECAYYGPIGGYSVQCVECNLAQSVKRRAAYARRKGGV